MLTLLLLRCWLCMLGIVLLTGCGSLLPAATATPTPTAINDPNNPPKPSPDLAVQEVVRIQVEALQNNDTPQPDSGIRTAFIFASPENKRATGPIERFIPLVKNPQYRDLLNTRRITINEPVIEGDQAAVEVALITENGTTARYLFLLSRQQDFPFEDCWMTDGVVRLTDSTPNADEI